MALFFEYPADSIQDDEGGRVEVSVFSCFFHGFILFDHNHEASKICHGKQVLATAWSHLDPPILSVSTSNGTITMLHEEVSHRLVGGFLDNPESVNKSFRNSIRAHTM